MLRVASAALRVVLIGLVCSGRVGTSSLRIRERLRKAPVSRANQSSKLLLPVLFTTLLFGCEEEKPATEAAAEKPAASVAAVAPPTASAEPPEPPKPREDCPEGSSGIGTSAEPCLGSGDSRMMEVKYTGKTTDEGPKFSVTNKSKKPILYGSVAAYFYDKAGKQLQVTADGEPRPKQLCSGNIFAGAVKPDEKIFVFFSCVKKEHVPEGTAAIEAEVRTVGFTDEAGKRSEFFWSNPELVPNERPKGGIKSKSKKK
jgi:hypothetical protein